LFRVIGSSLCFFIVESGKWKPIYISVDGVAYRLKEPERGLLLLENTVVAEV
jgi:hypothetical protein